MTSPEKISLPCDCGECNECVARKLGLDINPETHEKIPGHPHKQYGEILKTKPKSESERIDKTNLI